MIKNTGNVALKVAHVKKSFRLPTEHANGIKQAFINRMRGVKGYTEQHVLRDISFTVEKGDFFGIVGRNGSGKSTLLKLISQIYVPDSGKITVNGKLVPFIELGVGFNPELTGRENVYLNGALLGFSHEEVSAMYDEVVDFAELEAFMDQKLKNYSSGMQVRLAFSIAIKAQGDILVLDEVLAVGDSAFQQKCTDYFARLRRERKTVILVTHSMAQVERFCNKAILIEKGEILESGDVSEVTSSYENLFLNDLNGTSKKNDSDTKDKNFTIQTRIEQNGSEASAIEAKKPFNIILEIDSRVSINLLNIGVNIRDAFGNVVLSTDARSLNGQKELQIEEASSKSVSFEIENYFTNGEYRVDLVLVDEGREGSNKLLLNKKNITSFSVLGIKSHAHGMFHPNINLEVKDAE